MELKEAVAGKATGGPEIDHSTKYDYLTYYTMGKNLTKRCFKNHQNNNNDYDDEDVIFFTNEYLNSFCSKTILVRFYYPHQLATQNRRNSI